jgi:hypothetical protein
MTLVDQIDRFTRLALKAQSNAGRRLTLAVIKNPTMVAIRQANIAQWPQQVNDAPVQGVGEEPPRRRAICYAIGTASG